jgi:LysR family hydrogen peroxide-inducible transcriptional activator
MNLRDLDYLVALADTLHFGRAAEAVHVSQPTLSGQLRKLEETLGVALFERDSRNVALTQAGIAVVAEARLALRHAAAIGDVANAWRDPLSGQFRIGIIASLGPFLAPDLLVRLQHDAPRLEIVLTEALTTMLLAQIRARELDAVLIATEPDGDDLRQVPLFEEPFLIGHAPVDPLAGIEAPTLRDIADGTLLLLEDGHCLRDQALALCDAAAVDRRIRATSLITLIRMAATGHGVTLVPALASRWAVGLTLRPLAGETAMRTIRLVARRNDPRHGIISVVAAAVRAVAAENALATIGAG